MVFISYSQRDYKDEKGSIIPGNKIDRLINAFTQNGIDYWIDREGLDLGSVYAEKIVRNIKNCDTFLFLSSRNANASEWTLREISLAVSFGKKILPIRLDQSEYADSVSLYLSSIQYIDWVDDDDRTTILKITNKIKENPTPVVISQTIGRVPLFTKVVLYSGLVFLTFIYAILTYQFLWADQLRESQIIGGLSGYACEVGVLISIYYMIRLLRGRRCTFIIPGLTVLVMMLAGLMMRDMEVLSSGFMLLLGWCFVLISCLVKTKSKKSLLQAMDHTQMMLSSKDPETLILVYLIIKCCILVLAHFFGASMLHPIISPWGF